MSEERQREAEWHPARLIPTAGIRGQEEQEKRATSSLLAVMGAVPDFGHALLAGLGAPRGRISAFAEVATGFNDPIFATNPSLDQDSLIAASVPLGRQATPEDIAAAVCFLASDDAAYIVGHALVVDGGLMAT